MKNIIKKILAIWITIYLVIVPPIANAASPGGWAFSAFDVATSVVTAMKNGGTAAVTVAKSPVSQKIAKGIVGGAIVGAAIPLAISQITGIALNAVDWVLDPTNNAVKYKVVIDPVLGADGQYFFYSQGIQGSSALDAAQKGALSSTALCKDQNTACVIRNIRPHPSGEPSWLAFNIDNKPDDFIIVKVLNPNYVPGGDDYKRIPIPTVADKIFDNAKTDSASASIVNDAVKDYVNTGAADTALDAAKADSDATHNCGSGTHWGGSACVADTPKTDTPATPTDTPFDPSSIIDAISHVFDAVMGLPDVINNALDKLLLDIKDFFKPVITKVTDFVEWVKTTYDDFVKSPDPQDKTDVEIPTPDLPKPDTDINFGGSCPANVDIQFGLPGHTVPLTLMDWSKFCLLTAQYLKPIVIAIASFQAIRILGGQRESG